MRNVRVRSRVASDLPALASILARQQAESRYPLRWPLPFPVEDFLARDTESAAWVVEVDDVVAGHVSVCAVPPGVVADGFRSAVGNETMQRLALVSVLLVDDRLRGLGLGRELLATAVTWIRARGLQPALDVLPVHAPAISLYRRSGWREVGGARPDWLPDGEPDMVLMVMAPT